MYTSAAISRWWYAERDASCRIAMSSRSAIVGMYCGEDGGRSSPQRRGGAPFLPSCDAAAAWPSATTMVSSGLALPSAAAGSSCWALASVPSAAVAASPVTPCLLTSCALPDSRRAN